MRPAAPITGGGTNSMRIEDWILLAVMLAWIFLMAWLCKGSVK